MSTKKKEAELFDDATYQQFLRGLDDVPDISFNPSEDVAKEEERLREETGKEDAGPSPKKTADARKKTGPKKAVSGKEPRKANYVNLCLREDVIRKLTMISTLLAYSEKRKTSRSDLIERSLEYYLKKVHPKTYEMYAKLGLDAEGEDGDV